MTWRQWTAQFVAVCIVAALTGCGTVGLFGEYDVAESPDIDATPYPRLVDVPDAPPVGVYTDAVPDPAAGAATQTDLAAAATVADVRAAGLARVDPAANAADANVVAAANARAAGLAGPVISASEREEMLARARQMR